ncbi:MAG: FecR domain-containing protein [Phycisphaeraceae bacterium]
MSPFEQNLFDHVAELTELYLRNEISDEQLAELESLVRSEEHAADLMRMVLSQIGTMRVLFSEQREFAHRVGEIDRNEYLKLLQALSPTEEPEPVHLVGQINIARPIWQQWQFVIPSGIAALLAIAVTLIITLSGSTPAPTPAPHASDHPKTPRWSNPVVATLTATHNAQWGGPASAGLASGSDLQSGQKLTLTQGLAEITTNDGAIAILEAPATVELLDNNNAIRLHSGKLVGICETESSKGFLVRTPHLDITDLGTRFAVAIDQAGMTLAEVFDGKVVVAPSAHSGLTTDEVELSRGESRVVDAAGQVADRDAFPAEAFASVPRSDSGIAVLFGDADLAPGTIADRGTAAAMTGRVTLYPELRGHQLATDIPLTFATPGQYNDFEQTRSLAPAGTVIRTYILWHAGNSVNILSKGRVTFDGEILGAIGNERDWQAFVDATASDAEQVNKSGQHAALESVPAGDEKPNEQFTLSDDRRTLDFQFRSQGTDALRVIVREPVGDQP